jgi:hypothetical protein
MRPQKEQIKLIENTTSGIDNIPIRELGRQVKK